MAQAQFGGPLLVLRKDVCTACYIVFDLIERPPKLLRCGHVFCLLCLHCMKRENLIFCFICESPTPSPRDLAWLPAPTQNDRSFLWRVPDATFRPVVHGTDAPRRFPEPPLTWPGTAHFAQGNVKNARTFASNDDVQTANASRGGHRVNGGVRSAPTADEVQPRTEIGIPSLFGLALPHHSVPNALWNDPTNNVNGRREVSNEPSDSDYASSTVGPLRESPRGEPDGGAFGTSPDPELLISSRSNHLNNTSVNSVQVNRIPQEFVDLIEKMMNTATSDSKQDCWVFAWYLQEEAAMIHRNLLELTHPPSGTASHSAAFDSQSTRFGLDVIDHIKELLDRIRGDNSSADENLISELCAVLMYQRFKTFLLEKSRIGQRSVLIPATVRGDMPTEAFCLNGNFTVLIRSVDGVQTNTEKLDVPKFSKASSAEDVEKEKKNEQNSTAKHNQLQLKVAEPMMKDMANIYYMDFKIDRRFAGRVVVETHPSLTPLMSANFAVLCSGTRRMSYRGCSVFQTWYGQSIISGDTETNTGNGGRSVLNDDFFAPDQATIPAERGALGMRRLARNPVNQKGKVSSQFRILLNDQPRITGIFGHVISGIEVVDRISRLDDGNGNPRKRVFISDCGKLDF